LAGENEIQSVKDLAKSWLYGKRVLLVAGGSCRLGLLSERDP
jgi:hypothetical protein